MKPTDATQPLPDAQKQIAGPRLIQLIIPPLAELANRDIHGNRSLLFNHLVIAHLLAFFNPAIKSLRRIEDAARAKHVQKRLGLPRIPKSTLSDAQRVFDPQLLLPLIEDLKRRIDNLALHPRLDDLTQKLLAVDGTFFAVAPRVTWALFNKSNDPKAKPRKGDIRADFHFDILKGVPELAIITDGRVSEQATLADNLQPGCFYVLDRGYQGYNLLNRILETGSDFLARWREGVRFEVIQDRPLSGADRHAGVLSDRVIQIQSPRARQALQDRQLRLLSVAQAERPDSLFLLTNRMDLPAETIGITYRHRWQVELFFRWLKCMANLGHFFSESQQGMTLQVYVAIIGTLLIALQIGAKPSVYDYAMMVHVINGLVSMDEALEIMAQRREERARAAERQKAYNARKKNG